MTHPIDTSPEAIAALLDELRTIGCHENGDARCTCGIGQDAASLIARLTAERDEARAQAARWQADANLMLGFAQLAYESGAKPSSSELIAARDRCFAARDAAMRNEGRRQAAETEVSRLIWEEGIFCGQAAAFAETPFGAWCVVQYKGRENRWAHTDPAGKDSDDDWPTRFDAQAAAQADYEARILAALEPEGGE